MQNFPKSSSVKKCRRFLNMNITSRKEAVRRFGYCANCLAHYHSQNTCFTKTRCTCCHKDHDSFLHLHPRLQEQNPLSTSPRHLSQSQMSSSSTTTKTFSTLSTTSLSSLPRLNAIDYGSKISCISKKFADKHGLG